jgi:hypothetical protein
MLTDDDLTNILISSRPADENDIAVLRLDLRNIVEARSIGPFPAFHLAS